MTDIADFLTQNSSNFAVGGTVLSGFGQLARGQAYLEHGQMQYEAAKFTAAQQLQAANNAAALAGREAFDINRQTQMVASRALAVAAGTGGGASDPTVMNVIARIQGQGAYDVASAIYSGQARAQQLRLAAAGEIWSGEEARQMGTKTAIASGFGAVSSVMQGAASFYKNYGAQNTPLMTPGQYAAGNFLAE